MGGRRPRKLGTWLGGLVLLAALAALTVSQHRLEALRAAGAGGRFPFPDPSNGKRWILRGIRVVSGAVVAVVVPTLLAITERAVAALGRDEARRRLAAGIAESVLLAALGVGLSVAAGAAVAGSLGTALIVFGAFLTVVDAAHLLRLRRDR